MKLYYTSKTATYIKQKVNTEKNRHIARAVASGIFRGTRFILACLWISFLIALPAMIVHFAYIDFCYSCFFVKRLTLSITYVIFLFLGGASWIYLLLRRMRREAHQY